MDALSTQHMTIKSMPIVFFGLGSISRLPECIGTVGRDRVFVVTDSGVSRSAAGAAMRDVLVASGISHRIYDGIHANPGVDDIDSGAEALLDFGADLVVGFGGGTAMDCAKGISLAAANEMSARDLDYRNEVAQPAFPIIAVPTTAGTGSETNSFAVLEHPTEHRKFYVGNSSAVARFAILDPQLTMELPPSRPLHSRHGRADARY